MIRAGGRVRWAAGGLDGYVDRIEGQTAFVAFDNGAEQMFSLNAGVLEPAPFVLGDHVMRGDGGVGVVIGSVSTQTYPTVRVAFADGTTSNVAEMAPSPGGPG